MSRRPSKVGMTTMTSDQTPTRHVPEFTEWTAVMDHLTENGGRLSMTFSLVDKRTRAVVGYEFGREEPDNPDNDMVGGAAYGMGDTLDEALWVMAADLGIEPTRGAIK